MGVGDGRLEEGEVAFLGEKGLDLDADGCNLAQVEVEFVADDLQEIVAGLLVEAFGKVQEVAVRDVSGGVVMPGDAARQFGLGVDYLHPDVQERAELSHGLRFQPQSSPETFIRKSDG